LFYIINLVIYCFAVYFLFKAFRDYRRAGGLKGDRKSMINKDEKELNLKEKLLATGEPVSNKKSTFVDLEDGSTTKLQ